MMESFQAPPEIPLIRKRKQSSQEEQELEGKCF